MTTALTEAPVDETTMSQGRVPPRAPRGEPIPERGGEQRAEQTLAALPTAVAAAGLFVRHTLSGWQIDRDRARRIERAVHVLVVHSVTTTGVSSSAPLFHADYDRLRLLVVRLRLTPGQLVAEVWDHSEEPPHPQLEEIPAVLAVDELDFAVPLPGRRVVWCAVRLGSLPRRVPRPAVAMRTPATTQPTGAESTTASTAAGFPTDLYRRVLSGLHRIPTDSP